MKVRLLIDCFLLFVLFCVFSNCFKEDDSKDIFNSKNDTSLNKEIEKIVVFYDLVADYAPAKSNDLKKALCNIVDSLVFCNKNDNIFVNLERIIKTAKIDSTLFVGQDYIDTISYINVWVRNDVVGYIVDYGNYIDTISIYDVEYSEFQNGIYKDVSKNEVVMKTIPELMVLNYGKNDIDADWVIIYKYKNSKILNDTLYCEQFFNKKVRINSFISDIDSTLFDVVVDSINKRLSTPW